MAFYTEPRWEEAPEGTTGFLPETQDYWACWIKKVGSAVYTMNTNQCYRNFDDVDMAGHPSWTERQKRYIPHPEQERPEPDWSKAPEGTTGFTPNEKQSIGGDWTRVQNDVVLFWGNRTKEWLNTNFIHDNYWLKRKHLYIPRPSVKSVEPSAPVTEDIYFTHDWTAL